MYQLKSSEDTITAISTATGQGGIGIIRLSGKRALNIADQLFVPKNGSKPSSLKSSTVYYGNVINKKTNEVIDEALLTIMRAPKSYTKEDVVEVSCHGGTTSLRSILTLTTTLGARLAEPGEFTKRAFLNGRIDLTQAEAVLDIIQAKTDAFLQVSTNQLKGDLATELEKIREQLMDIYIEIEAIVNFPEDEIDASDEAKNFAPIQKKIQESKARVDNLLKTSEHGKILKDGIKIVLCGRPNVGKSSLLNSLLKTPRAIVSDIAGTTRDTIEETAQIRGIPLQLIDTAGMLEPRDLIEEEAIKRSRMHIAGADLVLLLFDSGADLTDEDESLMRDVNGENVLVILNKCDLSQKVDEDRINSKYQHSKVLKVSALKRTGIDALEAAIVENVWHDKHVDSHGLLVSNLRHIQALESCSSSLKRGQSILKDGVSLEFVSEEIKVAVNFLDSITGRNIDADLLNNIFSQFCIGK